ncbi:GNAT family N-acetyltransferase [Aciditerrimonas ferrireducens]|uniref:GNAT family N-acetyltransferase n=1 Tax=Aciditerrimonas ferrireducens TaxID=667306 RepID=UPI002005276F|nr:GNAT family N-acetyltransferase [Aciditerrimonas ferrireducens]MCK4177639.1 GNAT family N-acetyltransferase [Aciditerrimonas ferrireducens]
MAGDARGYEGVGARGPRPRRAVPAELPRLVEVLAEAFDDDPLACYLFPPAGVRRRGLRRFFRLQLRRLLAGAGEVWTTEDLLGAALWVPPVAERPASLRDLWALAPVLVDLLAGGRPTVALRLLADVERARPTEPHWYLATLGTAPRAQGRGIGSTLLQAVLARLDAEGLPAYLESSKERNVPFYARHGFEIVGEARAKDDPLTLWLMWRSPRPGPLG